MFSDLGQYEPAQAFSGGHYILLFITVFLLIIAITCIKITSKPQMRRIIRDCTICVLALEIIKIVFTLVAEGIESPNSYIPLYFCSLALFAGIFSTFGRGKVEHAANVFLATGGIVGGILFLIMPLSSLEKYPAFHFIAIQSFIYHGIMLYLGIQILRTKYISLRWRDFIYYFCTVVGISVIALIVNLFIGSNLMFISENYPGSGIEPVYNSTGIWFTPIMILVQATAPFIIVYGVLFALRKLSQIASFHDKIKL